jgi:hypothetical protein
MTTSDERTRMLEELQEEVSEINEVTSSSYSTFTSTVGPVYAVSNASFIAMQPIEFKDSEKPKVKAKTEPPTSDNKYSTRDIKISGDDILITTRAKLASNNISVEFSTRKDREIVYNLRKFVTDEKYFGSQDIFYFDKDFNYVEVTPRHNKRISPFLSAKNFPRIVGDLVENETRRSYLKSDNFSGYIIFDKKRFIESEGKVYKTRVRKNPNLEVLKEFKKKARDRFKKAKDLINFIRPMIKSIYDEENYEILYGLNFDLEPYRADVYIYLKFPNVTIKNSIEQEHLIEDLVVRLKITHDLAHVTNSRYFWMQKCVYMMRLTTNPIDAKAGYAHSHLGNNGKTFSDCCIGDNNMFTRIGGDINIFRSSTPSCVTELEFESVLLGVHDFVYWESLEGGPHMKMENIVERRGSEIHDHYNPFRGVSSTRTLTTTVDLANAIIRNKTAHVLKEAFVLVRKDGGFDFTINKSLLYERFHEAFKKDEIISILAIRGESSVKYNPTTKTFYRLSSPLSTWEDKVRNARKLVRMTVPIYMNGKILRPQLVKYEKEPEKDNLEIDTVQPEIILRIANVILYHLTKDLQEYVRTSKEEERRNT